jgi:hypothetical protein
MMFRRGAAEAIYKGGTVEDSSSCSAECVPPPRRLPRAAVLGNKEKIFKTDLKYFYNPL